jgi:hypothetical protein
VIDPHVVSLHYRLDLREGYRFVDPPAVEARTDDFTVLLDGNLAVVTMISHHADAESARAFVDPYLWAWELDAALRTGRKEFTFVFQRSEIVDRVPPAPGEPLSVYANATLTVRGTVALEVQRHKYADPPPSGFEACGDALRMWASYEEYSLGRSRFLDAANRCLTFLEGLAQVDKQKREAAARTFAVEYDVLSNLGRICGTRGAEGDQRKTSDLASESPLTESEKKWVDCVVRRLIRRVAEYGPATKQGSVLQELTMTDFPSLDGSAAAQR